MSPLAINFLPRPSFKNLNDVYDVFDQVSIDDAQIFEKKRQSGYKIIDQNVAEGCKKECFGIV